MCDLCYLQIPLDTVGDVWDSPTGKTAFGDYWTAEQKALTIPTKEMLAIVHALEASPASV
jgi:hypothetical protein